MDDTRTRADQEARRRLAVRRVSEGLPPKQVAAVLGVHVETVRKWVRAHQAGGDDALAATPHPGRTPFLTPDQAGQVLGWLGERPTAHGFASDLWTAARVAARIRQRFGVAFHPNYLREWMTARGYSPQKPAVRPRERDEAAVADWLADEWPAAAEKKGRPSS